MLHTWIKMAYIDILQISIDIFEISTLRCHTYTGR